MTRILVAASLLGRLVAADGELPERVRQDFVAHGDAAVAPLIAILAGEPDDGFSQIHAAQLLGELRAAAAVPALLRAQQGDELLESEALAAIVAIGPEAVDQGVAAAAALGDPDLRSALASALVETGGRDPRLLKLLIDDLPACPAPNTRALAAYGDRSALPALARVLEDAIAADQAPTSDAAKTHDEEAQDDDRLDDDDMEFPDDDFEEDDGHDPLVLAGAIEQLGGSLTEGQTRAINELRETTRGLDQRVSDVLAAANPQVPEQARRVERPGRNELCWCGSGRKYKKCHLDDDERAPAFSIGTPGAPRTTAGGYALHVALDGIDPPIWRRLEVPSGLTFAELHGALQTAMGWESEHPYEFRFGDHRFGEPDGAAGGQVHDDERIRLSDLRLKVGDVLHYTYDFGDSWEHRLLVERVLEPSESPAHVAVRAGARAGPPENCGGPFGYEDLLERHANPDAEVQETARARLGDQFDPDAFDLKKVAARLEEIR